MKKELWIAAVCGACLGMASAATMMAIAVPRYGDMLIPLSQAQDLGAFASIADKLSAISRGTLVLLFLCGAVAWRLLLRQASPAWAQSSFKNDKALYWLGWALALGLPLMVQSLGGYDTTFDLAAPSKGNPYPAFAAYGALLWCLLSPRGLPALAKEEQGKFFRLLLMLLIWGAGYLGIFLLLDKLDAGTALSVTLILGWGLTFAIWMLWRLTTGQDRPRLPLGNFRNLLQVALWGAACGLVVVAVLRVTGQAFQFYLEWVSNIGARSIEPNGRGSVLLFFGLSACFAAAAALILAWVPALRADSASPGERWQRAKTPLKLLLGLLIVAGVFYGYALKRNDWGQATLAEAAALPQREAPAARTQLAFILDSKNKPTVEIKAWEGMVKPMTWIHDAGDVPASAANVQALERYLQEGNSHGRMYQPAINALSGVYARLWDPRDAFLRLDELRLPPEYQGRPGLLQSILSATWICQTAPLTAENRVRLTSLGDDGHYAIPARWALKFAKAWQRYGDDAKAKTWEERAVKGATGNETLQKEIAIYQAQKEAFLLNGHVSGSVSLTGFPAGAKIRVGLFNGGNLAQAVANSPSHYNFRLVASQEIASGGRFSFDGLSAQYYFVCLLVDGDVKPQTPRHPGIPRLSAAHPSADLGNIVIKL